MKILLVGEFSGLHNNLKEGLVDLGHDVTLLSAGDGWKKFGSDIFLSPFKGVIGKVMNLFYDYRVLSKIKKYDVVQFMNPHVINRFMPRKFLLKKILKNNSKVFLIAAGGDSYFWKIGPEKLKYGPFEDTFKYDDVRFISYLKTDEAFDYNSFFVKNVVSVIPVMYEYETSYSDIDNLGKCIPLPINVDKIRYEKNIVKDKIIIFHGLNRYGFKGTKYVEDAFEYLSEKYPDELELIIKGNMPIDDYLKLMKRTNVVIDQVNSHSLGMNGAYALAMGKVVLGGAEPESLTALNMDSTPVINIIPSSQDLIDKIENLIQDTRNFIKIGQDSRAFIEKYHDHRKVASMYLEHWKKT